MDRTKTLLERNQAWARRQLDADPEVFRRQAAGQSPPFLWIGCADSRVVPEEITGSRPGELFVHRNVANLVSPGDLNTLSVIAFAVGELRVDHVVVCGHTRCGGVQAALGDRELGILDEWIRPIKDVSQQHHGTLSALSEPARWDRLVELNVRQQLDHLANTSFVQRRWREGDLPVLHGWVYRVEDGTLEAIARRTKQGSTDGTD